MEMKETAVSNKMTSAAGDEMKADVTAATEDRNAVGAAEEAVVNAADKKEPGVMEKAEPKKDAEPEIILQYREYEANIGAVTERVKAHYYAKGYQEGSIESMQIYVKPEDFTAYYVINDGIVGKVNLF